MECFYINLDAENDRRTSLEQNFERRADPGWRLNRFSAIHGKTLPHLPPGSLSNSEKACFLSHREAIRHGCKTPEHFFILEDDVWFGPRSAELILEAISRLQSSHWDVLFTDVCIYEPAVMLELFLRRRQTDESQWPELLDLRTFGFAGATAYIVNHQSANRLLAQLDSIKIMDTPYDLLLRRWATTGEIQAWCVFPFATSLSGFAENSQIQPEQTKHIELFWNMYRRMICADADHPEINQLIDLSLDTQFRDGGAELFGTLVGCVLSEKIQKK